MTVRHLLTMSSGCGFKEYGMVLEADWAKAFLDADYAFEPGEKMEYNSMNTYMLAAIVRRKTGEGLMEYLRPRLFEPLGFADVAWETCPLGTEKGGWGMYVRLEDALKLGLVYLNGGVWHTPQGDVHISGERMGPRGHRTEDGAPPDRRGLCLSDLGRRTRAAFICSTGCLGSMWCCARAWTWRLP